jgi:hypothetical protein
MIHGAQYSGPVVTFAAVGIMMLAVKTFPKIRKKVLLVKSVLPSTVEIECKLIKTSTDNYVYDW